MIQRGDMQRVNNILKYLYIAKKVKRMQTREIIKKQRNNKVINKQKLKGVVILIVCEEADHGNSLSVIK